MSVPAAPLAPPPPARGVPPTKIGPSRPNRTWVWLTLLIAVAAGGVWYWQNGSAQPEKAGPVIRTARVERGALIETLRLTGTTTASEAVSLTAPQLRGSRGDAGRAGAVATANSSATAVASTNTSSSTSSSSASSGSGSSSNLSSALRAATSRVNTSSGASSGTTSSASAANASATSSALGSDGLGSTSGSLNNRGGGGPGGGDFTLIVQKISKGGVLVKKGDVVAEFDRQYMLLRLDDYRAIVTQSEASLKSRIADLEVTRKAHDQLVSSTKANLEKARLDIKTTPVLSAIDAERLKLALSEAEAHYKQILEEVKYVEASEKAQIRSAEIDLEQSRRELRRAQANVDRMLVKAPLEGLVVIQTIFRGSDFMQIQQGDQLWPGQFFMSIVNPASMVINASVNQVDAERLRIGAKARVRFDAYPGLELPASLYSIAGIPRGGGMRQTFLKEIPVRLKLEKMDPRVIPDLSVSVDVVLDEQPDAVIAPRAAVQHGPDGRPFVYVEGSSGWTRREVELGLVNNTKAAIRMGLEAGQTVALDTRQGNQ